VALVQANGQTGLCRRFLSHLEEFELSIVDGIGKGKKKKERRRLS
jgi:hypothetical protein